MVYKCSNQPITNIYLQKERLILPVKLQVIDTDGQPGIFILSSMETETIKKIAANLGGNLGTTINLKKDATPPICILTTKM